MVVVEDPGPTLLGDRQCLLVRLLHRLKGKIVLITDDGFGWVSIPVRLTAWARSAQLFPKGLRAKLLKVISFLSSATLCSMTRPCLTPLSPRFRRSELPSALWMASPMQKLRVEVDSAPKPCPRCDNPVRTSPAVEYADLNALRRIQTQAMVPRVVFGIFLSAVNFGAGCPWTGLTFGCVPIINLIALPLLWLTERTGFVRDLAANGSCLCVLASLWLFGGGPGAAGLIAFVYIEQIQHRVEEPSSRASLWWVAFTFLFSLALCVVERTVDARHVTPQQTRLPETWYAILDWFCANFPGLLLYVTLSQLMDELTKSRRLLEESKAQAERLNEQLLEQQQRLQTERTLAHSLIANVFPRDVAASLIALFEQHANSPGGAGPEDAARAESRETPVGQLGVSDVFSSISCPDDLEPPEPAGPWDGLRDRVSRILTPCYRPFAAILFGDIVGFTSMAAAIDPSTVVQYLDAFFGCVDEVCMCTSSKKVLGLQSCPMLLSPPPHPE